MGRRVAVVGGIVAALAIGSASVATARTGSVPPIVKNATDPRDGGQLDLRRLRVRQSSCLEFSVGIWTWSAWNYTTLPKLVLLGHPPVSKNRLEILFDVNNDGKPDFTGLFIRRSALLIVDSPPANAWRESVRRYPEFLGVARDSPSHISVLLQGHDPNQPGPLEYLFGGNVEGVKTLGLAVTSVYGTHHDRIPNHGWLRFPTGTDNDPFDC